MKRPYYGSKFILVFRIFLLTAEITKGMFPKSFGCALAEETDHQEMNKPCYLLSNRTKTHCLAVKVYTKKKLRGITLIEKSHRCNGICAKTRGHHGIVGKKLSDAATVNHGNKISHENQT